MPQRQNRYWYESQRMIAVRDLPRYTTIYYTDVSIEMQRHTWMLPFFKTTVITDAKFETTREIRQYTGSTNVKSSYLFRS